MKTMRTLLLPLSLAVLAMLVVGTASWILTGGWGTHADAAGLPVVRLGSTTTSSNSALGTRATQSGPKRITVTEPLRVFGAGSAPANGTQAASTPPVAGMSHSASSGQGDTAVGTTEPATMTTRRTHSPSTTPPSGSGGSGMRSGGTGGGGMGQGMGR
jgi:hypothetical protein